MRLKKIHWLGLGVSLTIIIIALVFFHGERAFLFLTGLGCMIGALPFVVDIILQNTTEQRIADMFLEFSRNLAESVNTGTPISKSIINMQRNNYGPLSPNIEKLANQIYLGIPVSVALQNFSRDVNNVVVTRAVGLISEAEKAGGEIEYILDSVAKSVSEVEKIKKERQAAISSLVVQGYIIFFIFIAVMLIMEFKILPLTANIGSFDPGATAIGTITQEATSSSTTPSDLARPFLYLLLTQGFFAGFTIGKLSEGNLKAGVKHSFILTIAAFLISSGVELFFGA